MTFLKKVKDNIDDHLNPHMVNDDPVKGNFVQPLIIQIKILAVFEIVDDEHFLYQRMVILLSYI